jgi:flagellar assembly protein FliH
MNSWPETIRLSKPLRDLRRVEASAGTPSANEAAAKAQLEASYRRGWVDGERALNERLLQQRSEMQELLQGVVASLRKAVPQVVRDTENTLVALALAVAQKLVADIPISTAMVEASVRDALAQVEGTAQITVRLHRADLELLKNSKSPVLADSDAKQLRFLSSSEVTRGGCVVETRFGTIDARRETKLETIKKSFTP